MAKKDVVLWCSGATDITGTALAEALDISVTKNKPQKMAGLKLIIGWGAKTKENVAIPAGVKVFNHPNDIRKNRNKFEALKIMRQAGVNVPNFAEAGEIKRALQNGTISLPLIARTKYHQGGKGAAHCPTMAQVDLALNSETKYGYFQTFIPIQDEYRLHMVDGQVVYAAKKVQRSQAEMEKAYVEKELVRLESLSKKAKEKFDKASTEKMLQRQAKNMSIDPLIRSNTRGWKFSRVTKYPEALVQQASAACKAINLQFGAVDCCVDTDGTAWIIEVNTGPGLQESAFKAWTDALANMIDGVLKPAPTKTTAGAVKQNASKVEKAAKKAAAVAGKQGLQEKIKLMSEMAENVKSDEEAEVLKNVFGRMFGE